MTQETRVKSQLNLHGDRECRTVQYNANISPFTG